MIEYTSAMFCRLVDVNPTSGVLLSSLCTLTVNRLLCTLTVNRLLCTLVENRLLCTLSVNRGLRAA